jgi:hypothetical protein
MKPYSETERVRFMASTAPPEALPSRRMSGDRQMWKIWGAGPEQDCRLNGGGGD